MTPGEQVVVLRGPCKGDIGVVYGPDEDKPATRLMVRFPGNAFPNDFRSVGIEHIRPATAAERSAQC